MRKWTATMPAIAMDVRHPIDEEIRARLRKLAPNQVTFAALIGRNQPWLNKFMNGAGHATVDDVIRIAAVMIGLEQPAITETEQSLLKAVRGLDDQDRLDVIAYAKHRARLARPGASKGSSAPAAQMPTGRANKARGKR